MILDLISNETDREKRKRFWNINAINVVKRRKNKKPRIHLRMRGFKSARCDSNTRPLRPERFQALKERMGWEIERYNGDLKA